jgi:hypothetical protein
LQNQFCFEHLYLLQIRILIKLKSAFSQLTPFIYYKKEHIIK